jgi:hypothetical protein
MVAAAGRIMNITGTWAVVSFGNHPFRNACLTKKSSFQTLQTRAGEMNRLGLTSYMQCTFLGHRIHDPTLSLAT